MPVCNLKADFEKLTQINLHNRYCLEYIALWGNIFEFGLQSA